jgi:hypothetical protein
MSITIYHTHYLSQNVGYGVDDGERDVSGVRHFEK